MRQVVTLPGSIRPAPSLAPPASAQARLKREISAGSTLIAKSPDPVQPSSLREPGAQDPAGPQVTQVGPGPSDCDQWRPPPPSGRRGGDGGEVRSASRPGPGQWAAGARALELRWTQSPACPRAPQGRWTQSASHCTLCRQDPLQLTVTAT